MPAVGPSMVASASSGARDVSRRPGQVYAASRMAALRPRGLVVLVLGLGPSCAHPQPANRPTAALYGDLERLVTVQEATGWDIDRTALEDMAAPALMSVCQVPPDRRDELVTWLDGEIERAGGPIEEAWRKRGKQTSRLGDLLELVRIRMLLARAMDAAAQDCPFWLAPDDAFRGRQISLDRWQLSIGGDSTGLVVDRGGQTDLELGGGGRIVVGRTFGTHHGLYAGVELGGSASFARSSTGDRGALVLGFDLVTPVVYRYTFVNAYVEGEAGYLAHATENNVADVEHGVHVGVAFGGRATRRRWFFPGAALGLAYERTFPEGDRGPALTQLKLGFRVSLDADW